MHAVSNSFATSVHLPTVAMYSVELTSRGGGGFSGASGVTSDTGEPLEQVIRERDATIEDNRAVENAFADLHRRYEKLRASAESNKQVSSRCCTVDAP